MTSLVVAPPPRSRSGTALVRLLVSIAMGVIFVVQAAFFAWVLRNDHQGALQAAATSTGHVAHMVGELMSHTLDAADLTLQRTLDALDGHELGEAATDPALQERLRSMGTQMPHLGAIAIFDAQGRAVMSTTLGDRARGTIDHRRYFGRHAAGEPGPLVGEMVTGALSKVSVFTVSRAVTARDGSFKGVVVASIRAEHFSDFASRAERSPTGGVTVYDTDGIMVIREPLLPENIGKAFPHLPMFEHARNGITTGTFDATSPFDGIERIVSFRFLDRWPLVMVATTSRAEALHAWKAEAWLIALLLTGEAVVVGGLSWLILRSMRAESMARAETDRHARDLEKALGDKDMLMREVHHRVKNNFQMVVNLLHMEAASAGPETRAALEDSIGRVDAMAVVHELIYSTGEFSTLDARAYLERLCHVLAMQAPRVTLQVDAAAIRLSTEQALPLAIIVNEAVCNAFKHAFPGEQPGVVRVSLTDAAPAVLEITDNGVGLPEKFDPAHIRSLGIRLILAVSRQLGGRASFHSDNGTRIRLAIRRLEAGTE